VYGRKQTEYRIVIDRANITVNGKPLALPTTVVELEKIFGKPSRTIDKGGAPIIHVWDDIGIYCREYSAKVHDLSIALDRNDLDLSFYPKRNFAGSLFIDGLPITKSSTVASINSKRSGEKFTDQLYEMYWSVKYDRKSVGLGTDKQRRVYEVNVSSGLIGTQVTVGSK
jgi:hypothetical protein